MQYEVTLYIADKERNEFMKAADLKPDYKVFIDRSVVSFSTETVVDEAYLRQMMNASKQDDTSKFWIAAIEYNGDIYAEDGIKEISDGRKVGFVPGKVK